MKQYSKYILSFAVFAVVMVFCGIGIQKTCERAIKPSALIAVSTEKVSQSNGWQLKEPTEAAEFITGPLAADVGQLCVFRLNDPATRADWIIVPETTCYIDSSGSSLAFASNVPSKYSIIAAIVEDGVPKILTHICEYGLQPGPEPSPTPNPDPTPKPNPPPIVTLKDWVLQNVPDAGKSKAAALASCYESAAQGIENGSIRTQEAAFSVIRTASQTKIDIEVWSEFLDGLAEKIVEKLEGDNDVKVLGTIFSEIADGLKAVSNAETQQGNDIASPIILPFTPSKQAATCPDPTGRACQPQATMQKPTQYRWRIL